MNRNPSERCKLQNVQSHMFPDEPSLSMSAAIIMPVMPENTYLGHGTVLDNNVDADCCRRCPYKGGVFTRSNMLMKDGKPVPARCTGWALSYTTTGNIVQERGNPYVSDRELSGQATLSFKSVEERNEYMRQHNSPTTLEAAQRFSHFTFEIVPDGLPCVSSSVSKTVIVYSKHNPPRAI